MNSTTTNLVIRSQAHAPLMEAIGRAQPCKEVLEGQGVARTSLNGHQELDTTPT
jgi:hypothetical protein